MPRTQNVTRPAEADVDEEELSGLDIDEIRNLNRYRELVDRLVEKGGLISNLDYPHAEILTEALIGNARKSIYILTNKLDEKVYGDGFMVFLLSDFLSRSDVQLKLLVESPAEVNWDVGVARFVQDIVRGSYKDLASASNVEMKFVTTAIQAEYPFNFILVDDKNYRFEEDRDFPRAFAQFVGTDEKGEAGAAPELDIAGDLSKAFKAIWSLAKTPAEYRAAQGAEVSATG